VVFGKPQSPLWFSELHLSTRQGRKKPINDLVVDFSPKVIRDRMRRAELE